MAMTLEEVAERLNEAEVPFEASEDGGFLRVLITTDAKEYLDLEGNPALALFLMTGEKGLTIHSEPLLDVSKARFRGPLAQAVLELTTRFDYVRARYMEDPLSLMLTVEFLLMDAELTSEQLKAAVDYLCDCCILAKPFLQAAMDTGKVDVSLITFPDESSS